MTVAAAAVALTKSGDKITAPNVSRYLARFTDLPQRKVGKYRFVDLEKLIAHRRTNVQVVDKRASRELDEPLPAPRSSRAPIAGEDDENEGGAEGSGGSALNDANLRIKQLTIRDRELDLAVKEGTLVPDTDVMVVVTGVIQTFVSELERQETTIAARLGRDVSLEFRKARKAAQSKAAGRLLELARANLPEELAAKLSGGPGPEA